MTDVTISAADDVQAAGEDAPLIPPAAKGSPRFNLRATRAKAKADLFIDLPVPRWAENGDRLHLRCRAIEQGRIERFEKAREKSKDPDRTAVLNAQILAEYTIGVFVVVEVGGEEKKVGAAEVEADSEDADDPRHWPRFDDALADSLGVSTGLPATQLVREVFFTDGDLIMTATRLLDWSGYKLNEIQENLEGN